MKTFENIQQLIKQVKKDKACKEGIQFLYSCKNLQEVFNKINFYHCFWAIKQGYTQFEDYFDFEDINSFYWAELLKVQPQYADRCDLSKIDIIFWSGILQKQPQFAENFDKWNEFTTCNWSYLLQYQPQFADKCEIWDKFNGYDWSYLITYQPQFSDKCDWDKLNLQNWTDLLEIRPEFVHNLDLSKNSARGYFFNYLKNSILNKIQNENIVD